MDDSGFHIVVITSPHAIEQEAEWISRLLEAGVDFVHIRKPGWDETSIRHLLLQIPRRLRNRLTLHDCHQLAHEGLAGGIHLNSRNSSAFTEDFRVSRSCHSIDETELFQNLDYVTLSPIYDSISKPGYSSVFELSRIKPALKGKRIIALGGVRSVNFTELKEVGFYGAALLGAIWESTDINEAIADLSEAIKRYNT